MTEKPEPGSNRPPWDAEKEYPELCEQLRKGLSTVLDPELGLNVNQLGLIRNVKITADNVLITMILTTPFCPYGATMLEATRDAARKSLDHEVAIDLGWEPWDFSMMEEGLGGGWGLF